MCKQELSAAVPVVLLVNNVCSQLDRIYSVLSIKAGPASRKSGVIFWIVPSARIFENSPHSTKMLQGL